MVSDTFGAVAVTSVWFRILSVRLRLLLLVEDLFRVVVDITVWFGYFHAVGVTSLWLCLLWCGFRNFPCGCRYFPCACDYFQAVSVTSVWFQILSVWLSLLLCGVGYLLYIFGYFHVVSDTFLTFVITSMRFWLLSGTCDYFRAVAVTFVWFCILSLQLRLLPHGVKYFLYSFSYYYVFSNTFRALAFTSMR